MFHILTLNIEQVKILPTFDHFWHLMKNWLFYFLQILTNMNFNLLWMNENDALGYTSTELKKINNFET